MTGWIKNDIETAKAAMAAADRRQDPYRRMAERCKANGPQPRDPSLGFVANLIVQEPGIIDRINDEGFDARVAGVALEANPYHNDGERGWWRTGWFAADHNLRED